jgi:5-(carboxyamino)imidazole ribonucleotide synthase
MPTKSCYFGLSNKESFYHSMRFSNSQKKEESPSIPYRIGILGSGQLGQMMAMATKKLGHHVIVYDTISGGPASLVADEMIVAPFDDETSLSSFAGRVDLITLEFENIPIASLKLLASLRPLYPSPQVVHVCQDRILEKEFLQSHQIPIAPFRVVTSAEELISGLSELGAPTLLKTATLGYDGKGQLRLMSTMSTNDLREAWNSLGTKRAVLEKQIDFQAEGSVIVARSTSGEIALFPPQENSHVRGVLDISRAPARFPASVLEKVALLGRRIAEEIGLIGLLTVEFFLLSNDEVIVNELAPRPHNSGHHTIESSRTSQFEQAIRAVTGSPLGSTELLHPAIMLNLLGDLWESGEPDWKPFLEHSGSTLREDSFLHLYGKSEARPGRKMGHLTFIGEKREILLQQAKELLRSPSTF